MRPLPCLCEGDAKGSESYVAVIVGGVLLVLVVMEMQLVCHLSIVSGSGWFYDDYGCA